MKYKFVKPFSFVKFNRGIDPYSSWKEDWKVALHDPAFLIIWVFIIIAFILLT